MDDKASGLCDRFERSALELSRMEFAVCKSLAPKKLGLQHTHDRTKS